MQEAEMKLEISSAPSLLYVLDTLACEIAREAEFDEYQIHKISLAVVEAGANAIKHGNKGDPGKTVQCRFKVESGKLVISIQDEGNGFTPPEHCQCEPIAENGRGILLIRALMDDVRWKDNGRTIIITKRKG